MDAAEPKPASKDENATEQCPSCHHERHLSGIALKVYNLVWRLSKQSQDGTSSLPNPRIAKLVGASRNRQSKYISRCKTALVRDGWLEFLGIARGAHSSWSGGRYRAVSHSEWARRKESKLGHSPCHPEALLTKVSSVHPGGRKLTREARTAGALEGHTGRTHGKDIREGHTAVCPRKDTHRVSEEGHTKTVDSCAVDGAPSISGEAAAAVSSVSQQTTPAATAPTATISDKPRRQKEQPEKKSSAATERVENRFTRVRGFVLAAGGDFLSRPVVEQVNEVHRRLEQTDLALCWGGCEILLRRIKRSLKRGTA